MLKGFGWQNLIFFMCSLLVVICDAQLSSRTGSSARRPLTRQLVPQCTVPYFPNGEAKIRNRGRMLRYDCSTGYKLIGNRYSNCQNGRWDTTVPVCAKPGCPTLPTVDSGYILYEANKATAWLSCFERTELAGAKNTYCNGTHWDRPLGICRQTGASTPTTCDFETESWCGWTNDALHDFDWKRSDGSLNPRALRTGPKYDHTTMQPKAGHYMIVDSNEQFTNDTARLISPLYEPEYSQNACFQFYYHMYGETVGTLRVFVKPLNSDLYDLKPLFEQRGNQKNVWHEGNIAISNQEERFQIVFEASLGNRYKSDIAIDDVSLLQGEICRAGPDDGLDNPEEPPTDVAKIPVKIETCENRCGSSILHTVLINDTIATCDCHEDCVTNDTCCPDYRERCVFEVDPNEEVRSASSTATTVTTTSTTTTAKAIPVIFVDNTTISTSTVATTITTSSTSTTSTTTKPPVIRTTTTLRTTSTSTRIPSTTSTKTTTTRKTTSRTTTTKSPGRTGFVPLIPRERVTTTTAKPIPRTIPTTVVVPETTTDSTVAVPETTLYTIVRSVEMPSVSQSILPAKRFPVAVLWSGAAVLLFVTVLAFTIYHVRRSRTDVLARLKEKSQKKFVEDIRFLAGDEDLDFNITSMSEGVEQKEKPDGRQGAEVKSKIPAGRTAPTATSYGASCEEVTDDDSSDDDGAGATGGHGSSKPRGKKSYDKYVKSYDEDMQATLL
ncbi:MAM and LDL-receptor class A domain-containing protein 1-like [Anopheles darlingi]|uniref:MAM and LDL-receptor class A domain-containing protein 1-like n=1 Tax=Anopheles darlingi TaxID=43151 RepID=UPI0021002E5F|nr:MAM and LDL-receptor class A domain-containing protein 1-like [Anopheles darlingi]